MGLYDLEILHILLLLLLELIVTNFNFLCPFKYMVR